MHSTSLSIKNFPLSFSRFLGTLVSLLLLSLLLLLMLAQNAQATLAAHPSAMNSALKAPSQSHWQTIAIKNGDNLDKIFSRLGLSKQQLHKIIALRKANKTLTNIHATQKLQVLVGAHQEVQGLSYTVNEKETLVVSKQVNDSFKANITHHAIIASDANNTPLLASLPASSVKDPASLATSAINKPVKNSKPIASSQLVKTTYKQVAGSIHRSIYLAGKKAGLPAKVINQFVNAINSQIDASRIAKSGDQFSIVFEPGKNILVAAAFSHQGKVYQAIRFTDSHGHIAYYSPLGTSLGKAFLRNPVPGSHVTSHYSLARLDPIVHEVRPHHGVDFAAPYGSPIKAAGDGKVIFVGQKSGYGNTIIIQHDNKYSSMYGHMAHFAKTIHLGKDVEVGQVIGYVGSSGMSTGPHLHYAFLQNGNYQDPLRMTLPSSAKRLPKAALARFMPQAHAFMALLTPLKATSQMAANVAVSKKRLAHNTKTSHLSAIKHKLRG